jgi:hypothetical protein
VAELDTNIIGGCAQQHLLCTEGDLNFFLPILHPSLPFLVYISLQKIYINCTE